jgi:hypothetical protein
VCVNGHEVFPILGHRIFPTQWIRDLIPDMSALAPFVVDQVDV